MKKHILYLTLPLLLAACANSKTPVEQIAMGEPIKPIRMVADTTEIFTTDYMPLLMAQNGQVADLDWIASERLEVILPAGHEALCSSAGVDACAPGHSTIHLLILCLHNGEIKLGING